jgi:tetratricopeptide (TPR) repeat protein
MSEPAANWNKVKEIFADAQEVEPSRRAAFVRSRTPDDPDLEREVLRLLALDGEAGSFLETPAVADPGVGADSLVHAGDVLAGRYRIVSAIGRGGMGEVFEAHDDVLAETIAVKVVRPGMEPVEAAAARWRREVQLARKVSHSGVCRVHDVAIHREGEQELLFLTMERLRGESLQARIARNDLDTAGALAIARQLGEALDAAHQQGVLHRDIKPDNVILDVREDGRTRAVITDFGLARDLVMGVSGPVTRSGWVAGTPGYLAPELLRGEPPTVASDLYALAVVVRNLFAGAAQAPGRRVGRVFSRALDPDPAGRFTSARAFLDALETALRPALRRWRVALASAVIVALLAAAFRFYFMGAPGIAAASQVLMTDMVNGTGEPEFDGAGEVLRTQLAQSPQFELVDDGRIRQILALMSQPPGPITAAEVAREVAMRDGVPLVVYASLTRLGQDRVLGIKLEEMGARPTTPRRSWTQSFTAGSKSAVFEALHDAAVWIRRTAGEVPASLENQDRAPSDTTTSQWEALRLFRQAGELSSRNQTAEATLLLEQAIRIDPEFAMAYTRLGDNLISLKREREGYAAWDKAIALAERRQLTSRETLRIRGQYFDDTGNLIEAEKAYRAYSVHYPTDFLAAFLLGGVLTELDRVAEAVPWLERAHQIRPSALAGGVHLAVAYLDLGRPPDADRIAVDLESTGDQNWPQWVRALGTFTIGDVDGALAALEPLRVSTDLQWRSRAHTIRASWLSERGDDRGALEELRAGIELDSVNGFRDRMADKWLHVADLQQRHLDKGVEASVRTALAIAPNARRLASAIRILVRAGHRTAAQRLMPEFEQFAVVPATTAARDRARAELLRGAGQTRQALQAFEQGFAGARRSENRLPLIQALTEAGDAAAAERLLQALVDHPIVFYIGPEPQAPGLYRQAVTSLAAVLARRDPAAAAALRTRYPAYFRTAP